MQPQRILLFDKRPTSRGEVSSFFVHWHGLFSLSSMVGQAKGKEHIRLKFQISSYDFFCWLFIPYPLPRTKKSKKGAVDFEESQSFLKQHFMLGFVSY